MSNNTFWFLVWTLAAATPCVIAGLIVADDMYATARFSELVAHGADPLTARCGMWGGDFNGHLDCNLFRAVKP